MTWEWNSTLDCLSPESLSLTLTLKHHNIQKKTYNYLLRPCAHEETVCWGNKSNENLCHFLISYIQSDFFLKPVESCPSGHHQECKFKAHWAPSTIHLVSGLNKPARWEAIHLSIICYRFSPFYGVAGVFAGANPSCLWARAGYTLDKLPAHRSALTNGRGRHARSHQEQFGVQYLAQGHFDMQLSSARSWDLNQWLSDH